MNYSHIIFDWDGTVMDSAGKIVSCMQEAALKANLAIPSADEVRHIIGISLQPAIAQLFNISNARAEQVAMLYKEIFIEQDNTPSKLFPGALDIMESLHQTHTLGVATGKARRGLERAWTQTATKHFFSDSRCADEAESKPSSDMLLQLLDIWKVSPQDVLMIGDTVYDMQMAENIGMPRLGVSYGVHSVSALQVHKPVAIVDDIRAVLDYA